MTTSRRPLPANFRAEALRQAREAQRLRGMLDAMKEDIALWAAWMSRGDVWDRVRAACGPGEFGALAERVGLDPATATARDVFLTALSSVGAYETAWRLALRFSTGADRDTFLAIWRMEKEVNELARQIFHGATYFYRGQSVNETIRLHDGTVGYALHRSFVSLSSSILISARFAFNGPVEYRGTPVVLVVDARKARKAGAVTATYSLASDILDLPQGEEGVGRTFPLRLAHELQVHFHARWPLGSEAAMVAIITTSPPTRKDMRLLEGTGTPILDCRHIFSHH